MAEKRATATLHVCDGKRLPLSEWSRLTGLPEPLLYNRLNRGWSFKKAITTPIRPYNGRKDDRRRAKRTARRATGLCYECGSPADGFHACLRCRRQRSDYEQSNQEKFKQLRKNFQMKQKRLVFEHYGLRCECCGEDQFEFLTLDHPDDDGRTQRQKVGSGGRFYHWLVKNNFPSDHKLRTLCFNCNQGRRVAGGVCPHQLAKRKTS